MKRPLAKWEILSFTEIVMVHVKLALRSQNEKVGHVHALLKKKKISRGNGSIIFIFFLKVSNPHFMPAFLHIYWIINVNVN